MNQKVNQMHQQQQQYNQQQAQKSEPQPKPQRSAKNDYIDFEEIK